MYSRYDGIDAFFNKSIQMQLIISNSNVDLLEYVLDINRLFYSNDQISFLRTPDRNLLELESQFFSDLKRKICNRANMLHSTLQYN